MDPFLPEVQPKCNTGEMQHAEQHKQIGKGRDVNTLKDAFCRMRGADVEHAAALDELDAIGACIECAMRVDAAIYKQGNTSQDVQSVKLPEVVRSSQRRSRDLSGTSASLAMCGQPTFDECRGNRRQRHAFHKQHPGKARWALDIASQ